MSCPSNGHLDGTGTSNPASRTPSSCVGQMDTQPWTRILRPLGRHWQRLGEAETRRTVIGTGFIGSLQFVQFPYKIVDVFNNFIIAARPKKNSLQGMSCQYDFPGFRLIVETACQCFLLSVAW